MKDDTEDSGAGTRGAIRTRYAGRLFRSKLEADWARFFDSLAIPWEYEKEGAYYGDVFYLPDFWLPRSKQHVEVKGRWEPDDLRKVLAFLQHSEPRPFLTESPDIRLICCRPDGRFDGLSASMAFELGCAGDSYRSRALGGPADLPDLLLHCAYEVTLAQCAVCRGWWFFHEEYGWQCQCCGVHRGRRHLAEILASPIVPWPVRS